MWRMLNLGFIAYAFIGAYFSAASPTQPQENLDYVAYAAIFLTLPLVSLGGTYYGLARLGFKPLPGPSLSRNPVRFWCDPFQFLTTSAAGTLADSLGRSLHFLIRGNIDIQSYRLSWAFAGGTILGLGLAYRVFHRRIAPST